MCTTTCVIALLYAPGRTIERASPFVCGRCMGVSALLATRVSPEVDDRRTTDRREMERKSRKIAYVIISIILALVFVLVFLAFVGLGGFSPRDVTWHCLASPHSRVQCYGLGYSWQLSGSNVHASSTVECSKVLIPTSLFK